MSEQRAVTLSSFKRVITASHKIFIYVKNCSVRHQSFFAFPYFYLANACSIFLPAATTIFRSVVHISFSLCCTLPSYLFIRCLLIYFSFSFLFQYSFVFLPVYCDCFRPFTFLCLPLFISLVFHFVYFFMSFDNYSSPLLLSVLP